MNGLIEEHQLLPKCNDNNGTPNTDPLIRRHTTPDMAASAAYGMVLCGTDELENRYRGRIEKVKFGVPVNEAFSPDIPATLLVLLLKVNKEGPLKKDIWRAPGNQAQVRKLSSIMQHGRLVNISNISVYTAASVIKRFLAKLPGGILGADNEKRIFDAVERNIGEEPHRELFCQIISSLPTPSQHLLVLLFGTFRVITDSAETFGTRMTPEAIGISVAPSLFHTCIHDGQRAKLADVMRFKLASKVISDIIRGFGYTNLFPRECYEFYARITAQTLRVDEQWHFSFHLPSNPPKASKPEVVVSRKSSRRSHRKSSTSSSTASLLSQLQTARNLATSNKTISNATDLGIKAIYRSASQRAAAVIQRTGSIHHHVAEDPILSSTTQFQNVCNALSTPPHSMEGREKREAFFLLSPSVTTATAGTPTTTHRQTSTCFPSMTASESAWCIPVKHHQPQFERRKISAIQQHQRYGPPLPPPPTMALQHRIDAYCAAANINPRAEFKRSRSQHFRKDNDDSM